MTAQEYIETKLNELRNDIDQPRKHSDIKSEIYRRLTSRKYRKCSMTPEFSGHVRKAIEIRVNENLPINITLTQGAYKLWSLDEAPFVDWAELFANIRHLEWLKRVCDIYTPGVEFEIFFDDAGIPYYCNLDFDTTKEYIKSYIEMFDVLKLYFPNNFKFKPTTVSSKFDYPSEYESIVREYEKEILSKNGGRYPDISERLASVELNAKPIDRYKSDPLWREKNLLTYDACLKAKNDLNYHLADDKIHAFAARSPFAINVGTVSLSAVKYWTGTGALRRSNPYSMDVLSPKQLATANFIWEEVDIKGLSGKNFHRIRVLN